MGAGWLLCVAVVLAKSESGRSDSETSSSSASTELYVLSPPRVRMLTLPLSAISHRKFDLHNWLAELLRRHLPATPLPSYRIQRLVNRMDSPDTHIFLEARDASGSFYLAVSADLRWPALKKETHSRSLKDMPAWAMGPVEDAWKESLPPGETVLVPDCPPKAAGRPAEPPHSTQKYAAGPKPLAKPGRLLPAATKPWVCVIGPHPPNYLHAASLNTSPPLGPPNAAGRRSATPRGRETFSVAKAAAHARMRVAEFEQYLNNYFAEGRGDAKAWSEWQRLNEEMIALRATLARLKEQESALLEDKEHRPSNLLEEIRRQQASVDRRTPAHSNAERKVLAELFKGREAAQTALLYYHWRAHDELKRMLTTELVERESPEPARQQSPPRDRYLLRKPTPYPSQPAQSHIGYRRKSRPSHERKRYPY